MSALTKFFDTIRPLSTGINYGDYSIILNAATELSNQAYTQGFADAERIYKPKESTPESIVNNTPETHSVNVL